MSEIVTTARTARELLAKGLGALQANPNVSPQYLDAAEPIAVAMGALHRIEQTAGAEVATASTQALDSIRRALAILQTQAVSDPHMASVMETVASSLGHVFGLTKVQPPQASPPAQPAAAAQATQPVPQMPPAAPQAQPQPAQAAWQQPAPQPQPAQAPWQQQPAPQPQPAQPPWQQQPAPQPQPAQPPWQQQPAPQPQPAQAPWQQQPAPQPQPAQAPWQQPQPAPQASPYAPPPQPAQPSWQQQPAPQPQPAQPPWQQQPAQQPQPAQAPWQQPQPAPQASPYAPPPQPAQQPWQQQPAPQPQPAQQPWQQQPAPQPQPAQAPWQQQAAQQPAPAPFAPPQVTPQPAPFAPARPAAGLQNDPFAAPAAPVPAPAAPGAAASPYAVAPNFPLVEAELGAHSPTNFYKGLMGNDVVDHGGIFVATYKIPNVGDTLRVHVSLPGGYEFEALGLVRWTRESRDSMTSDISPPGFGLQFTQISNEARQLVYRYVRNREPLFHDDL